MLGDKFLEVHWGLHLIISVIDVPLDDKINCFKIEFKD